MLCRSVTAALVSLVARRRFATQQVAYEPIVHLTPAFRQSLFDDLQRPENGFRRDDPNFDAGKMIDLAFSHSAFKDGITASSTRKLFMTPPSGEFAVEAERWKRRLVSLEEDSMKRMNARQIGIYLKLTEKVREHEDKCKSAYLETATQFETLFNETYGPHIQAGEGINKAPNPFAGVSGPEAPLEAMMEQRMAEDNKVLRAAAKTIIDKVVKANDEHTYNQLQQRRVVHDRILHDIEDYTRVLIHNQLKPAEDIKQILQNNDLHDQINLMRIADPEMEISMDFMEGGSAATMEQGNVLYQGSPDRQASFYGPANSEEYKETWKMPLLSYHVFTTQNEEDAEGKGH